MKTQNHFDFQYGKVEMHAKMPTGAGLLAQLMLLGNDISTVGQPTCGEIHIADFIGRTPNEIHSSVVALNT